MRGSGGIVRDFGVAAVALSLFFVAPSPLASDALPSPPVEAPPPSAIFGPPPSAAPMPFASVQPRSRVALQSSPFAAPGGEPPSPRPPTFAEDVAPLLARWCTGCHGGDEPEGRLRLDRWASVLAGGKSGPPVIIFDPAASLIIAKVERRERTPMPPRKRLPRAAVMTLRAWIAAGAPP